MATSTQITGAFALGTFIALCYFVESHRDECLLGTEAHKDFLEEMDYPRFYVYKDTMTSVYRQKLERIGRIYGYKAVKGDYFPTTSVWFQHSPGLTHWCYRLFNRNHDVVGKVKP